MGPFKHLQNHSGSEDDNSSSDSESSDSGSDSKSEAGSVHSRQSLGSQASRKSGGSQGSRNSTASRQSRRSAASGRSKDGSKHSSGSDRSRHSSSSDRSQHSGASGSPASARSAQSPAERHSRSPSATGNQSSSDGEEGNLILDERKSRSRSRSSSRSSSSAPSAKSNNTDEEREAGDGGDSPDVNDKSKQKRKRIISQSDAGSQSGGSDGESKKDGGDDEATPTAEGLFGEAGDISSEDDDDDDNAKKKDAEKQASDDERRSRSRSRDREEDEEEAKERDPPPEEVVPETKIECEIPYIQSDIGKELHFVKLPNFLSVEPRPYDAETYEDEVDEEENLDEEGRARLKLKVENTMRWRTSFDKEGNAYQESNTRMVKWSDGSLSLFLGSEVFDVYRQPLQGDHNHLFIRQGTGLQGQAVFRTKLTFRPHSTDSFTHRKMTLSLADRSQKTSAIKILGTVGNDPEANRLEKIKSEEMRLRASVRQQSKQKRTRERTAAGRGMSGNYLEPDRDGYDDSEDEGAISLAAIKNKFKRGGDLSRQPIYSSEEDASDIEDRKAKKLIKTKALQDSEDEEGGAEDEEMKGSSSKGRAIPSDSGSEDSD